VKEDRKLQTWIRAPGPAAPGMRIGLLGGSFNPAHHGHIHASEQALKQLKLDYVWWLVSPQNPLKTKRGMASFAKRLQAARAVARHPRIVVTPIEEALNTRFTIDTLRTLKRRFPQVRFVWLMGSDNMLQIPRWKDWQDIYASVPIAVIARAGSALKARLSPAAARFKSAERPPNASFAAAKPPSWTILDAKRDPASATALRTSSRK
jgi:nicotinate-nucleotide adenylyltransferase